jgi:NNP family nitrate/nitrite transporter-like MFS transporter
MRETRRAQLTLLLNTLAFTVCFAVWTMYGVLVTFLVDQRLYAFGRAQMGWLIGVPVLTGSLFRLPAGLLADCYGGRPIFAGVMLLAALSAHLTSYADGFWSFLAGGLGFGLAGSSFAVGVAYTSLWFPPRRQGAALGIFGMGNVGAAITTLSTPWLLEMLTRGGSMPERWRTLPRLYAVALVAMAVAFWLFTSPRKPAEAARRTLAERLRPLRHARVWRFGLYYFLVFGGFVALTQWLLPYYVNVYGATVVTAGLLTTIFALPTGAIRPVGGWMSDRLGARAVMYGVLGGCVVGCLLLVFPPMNVESPGEGVAAARAGTVTAVGEEGVEVDGVLYRLQPRRDGGPREGTLFWPVVESWQEPAVARGERVVKRQLLARGVTHVHFQANVWVFTGIVFALGLLLGSGSGAVYKYVSDYFPKDVGTVGGVVGMLGGLGGFVCPVLFGYLLEVTGIWTSCWVFLLVLSVTCLVWLHSVVRRMLNARAPEVAGRIEEPGGLSRIAVQVRCPIHGAGATLRLVVPNRPDSGLVGCSLLPGAPTCERACLVRVEEEIRRESER